MFSNDSHRQKTMNNYSKPHKTTIFKKSMANNKKQLTVKTDQLFLIYEKHDESVSLSETHETTHHHICK